MAMTTSVVEPSPASGAVGPASAPDTPAGPEGSSGPVATASAVGPAPAPSPGSLRYFVQDRSPRDIGLYLWHLHT
eukprot:9573980-Lingulodinium_polyedra.AAC.1